VSTLTVAMKTTIVFIFAPFITEPVISDRGENGGVGSDLAPNYRVSSVYSGIGH